MTRHPKHPTLVSAAEFLDLGSIKLRDEGLGQVHTASLARKLPHTAGSTGA
jgi:hypothetical protein